MELSLIYKSFFFQISLFFKAICQNFFLKSFDFIFKFLIIKYIKGIYFISYFYLIFYNINNHK